MKQVRRDSSQVCSVQGTPGNTTDTRTVNTQRCRTELRGQQNRPCFHHVHGGGVEWEGGESVGLVRSVEMQHQNVING